MWDSGTRFDKFMSAIFNKITNSFNFLDYSLLDSVTNTNDTVISVKSMS